MRRVPVILGATAASLAASLGVGLSLTPAQPVSALVTPKGPTSTAVKQVSADIDGDGRADQVTFSAMGGDQYELKVVAAAITARTTVRSTLPGTSTPAQLWYGVAKLDGVKGGEIIVRITQPHTADRLAVFTWRKGALVASKAPATPGKSGWRISEHRGFRFFTSHGRAYVEAAQLNKKETQATIVRSVWRHGKWVKLSTLSKKVTYSAANRALGRNPEDRAAGLNAPSLLTGQLAVDIDGDGTLDTVSERIVKAANLQWKIVTSTGAAVTRTEPIGTEESPVGIAELDGAPGAEVVVGGPDEGSAYRVLSWRGGTLVTTLAPTQGISWPLSDEFAIATGYTFSEVGGQHQVISNARSIVGPSREVEFVRYAWIAGSWAKQESWVKTLDQAAWDVQCSSFCGVSLAKP